jgi:hypothetical protein
LFGFGGRNPVKATAQPGVAYGPLNIGYGPLGFDWQSFAAVSQFLKREFKWANRNEVLHVRETPF